MIAMLLAVEYFVEFGIKKTKDSYYYKVNLVTEHISDPDIVIFGSSVGEVGIDPRIIEDSTGRSAYNFSIDGTRFAQYSGLITEMNEHAKPGKLYIFAETYFSLTKMDQLTEVDRFVAHIGNDNIYEPLYSIQPDLMWKLKYIPFYKFVAVRYPYYRASATGLKNWMKKETFTDSLKGFTPKYKSWESDLDARNAASEPKKIGVEPDVLDRYKKVVDELTKKGNKVMIVLAPVQNDGLKLLPNIDELRNAFKSIVGNGAHFYDYSDIDLSMNKKWFYNNSHLNNEGAAAFTKMLIKDVKQITGE
jgi:hypothetical protein